MRTQVGIVGAGPAGLMLAHLLHLAGVESVVLEARSRAYVEQRVRAGVLEQGTVDLLVESGVGERLLRERLVHHGIELRFDGRRHRIDLHALTGGRTITVYGQQEVVKDLIAARHAAGGPLLFEVDDVTLDGIDGDRPAVSFRHGGAAQRLECAAVAGCDGFHGVCRPAIPDGILTVHDFEYPFGWLGILAEASPATDELIYAWHERGFALYSMRSPAVSRLYIQVPIGEDVGSWPDDRVWEELQLRLGTKGWSVNEGPVFDKGITPMRSYVCEPMRFGRLLLAGDSAHIVPPTGAKGLNLAVNDARLMAGAIISFYRTGSAATINAYSETALRRVWRAQDFSNYMTQLLHDLGHGPFERKLQLARLEYLSRSRAAATSLAENYAGLPAGPDF